MAGWPKLEEDQALPDGFDRRGAGADRAVPAWHGQERRPARADLREVLNAIRYLARSGGGWRMLPKDFPPWPTVYWWFRRFVRRFLFQTIHDVALMLDRERVGREASPTGGVIDSQSVKAPEAKTRGYDAGKKIVGRKRHRAVHFGRTEEEAVALLRDTNYAGFYNYFGGFGFNSAPAAFISASKLVGVLSAAFRYNSSALPRSMIRLCSTKR